MKLHNRKQQLQPLCKIMVKNVLQLEFGVVLLPWMFGVTTIVIIYRYTVQKVFALAINE